MGFGSFAPFFLHIALGASYSGGQTLRDLCIGLLVLLLVHSRTLTVHDLKAATLLGEATLIS